MIEHFGVPEPEDAETAPLQDPSPALVVREAYWLGVLPAVQLDREHLIRTEEVDNKTRARLLPPPLITAEAPIAQPTP